MTELETQLYEALVSIQWGFNHARCIVCSGWMCGPNGETDRKHTKTCPVANAIKTYEKKARTK